MLTNFYKYVNSVLDGTKAVGRTERQCVERFIRDRDDPDFPYYFDEEEADKHIKIANSFTIVEGAEPRPLRTRGFQDFIIGSLRGWKSKATGHRRYRESYIQMGRQNGKSFLSGFLCVDYANFSGYHYGRVFCAATKKDQAKLVWQEVAKFIRGDQDLAAMHKVKEYVHEVVSYATNTKIQALSGETKSADGMRSILAIIDEFHAHPTGQMYKLLLDGQIRVDGALTHAITTAGFNLNSPCYKQYQFCKRILSGALSKDSLFIFIAEMDEDDDIWEPKNWAKANPLILCNEVDTINEDMLERMAEKAIDAKEKGQDDLANFLTKPLNKWITFGGDALVSAEDWAKCGTTTSLEDMRGRSCYLGIDLSSGGDLTSISLVFKLEGDGRYIYSHSFIPKGRLAEHEKTDLAPYRMWVNQGLITVTEGAFGIKTDYSYILSHLQKIINEYDLTILQCGYDSHNAGAFLAPLDEILDGAPLIEIKQSARSLSDATKDFILSTKAGSIQYDKSNELLTWSVLNAVLTYNSFGECKVEKNTSTQRIDPVDSILDAWKLAMAVEDDIDINASVDDWFEMMGADTE